MFAGKQMPATMVGGRRKIKKKHWLKCQKKTEFEPKYKLFKILYLKIFFENSISDIQSFYICPDVPQTSSETFFFNFKISGRKSKNQQKLAKKIKHSTRQFR